MLIDQDMEILEFTITVKQVKLCVKFPCKLTLNYNSRAVKSDIAVNEHGAYVVQRQVKVKSENKQPIQLTINLTTEKGGNIMAGVIKLIPTDLAASEGNTMTVGLQKCLDQNSSCLIKVDRVWISKVPNARSVNLDQQSRIKKNTFNELSSRKRLPSAFIENYPSVETRSEHPGFDPSKNLKNPRRKEYGLLESYNQRKVYAVGPKSYAPQAQFIRSKDRSMQKRAHPLRALEDDSKTVGKRQVDPAIRLTLEANQKSLKMDILKYKMKSQEHQKTIEEKKKLIKKLKEQISDLHRQTIQKNFYQQEINSKNLQIQKLEDSAKHLNKQNSSLRNKVVDLERSVEDAKNSLRSTVSKLNEDKQRKEGQHLREVSNLKDENSNLQNEIISKSNQISRIKHIVDDLQKSLEGKTFEYQITIQNQRAEMQKLQTLLNEKNKQLEIMLQKIKSNESSLQAQLKKKSQQAERSQLNTESLSAELKETLQLQNYYATYKVKFNDLTKQHERLNEQKKQVQKHYEKLIQTKQNDLGQFKSGQMEVISQLKKKNAELCEKCNQLVSKAAEQENKIALANSEEQKLRRAIKKMENDLSRLTEAEKNLAQINKVKDEKMLNYQKELSDYQMKSGSKQGLLKKDAQYKEAQLERISQKLAELESQFKAEKQKNENLRFQCTKSQGKNKLQEEIINQLSRQLQQNRVSEEKRQASRKEQVRQMNDKIKALESIEKGLSKKILQYQIQDLNKKNEVLRLSKQIQIRNQKLQDQSQKLNQVSISLKQIQHQFAQKSKQLLLVQGSFKELQNSKRVLQADFSKTEKIKTIIIDEKASAQNEVSQLKRQLQNKQKENSQIHKQLKELKEILSKTNLKLSTVIKQYERFKQSIYTSINNSFYQNRSAGSKSFNQGVQNNGYVNGQTRKTTHSFNSIDMSLPINLNHSNKKVQDSSIMGANYDKGSDRYYEPNSRLNFTSMIETYGKQSQQTITMLSETVRKNKAEIERLQNIISSNNTRIHDSQQEASSAIRKLNNDLEMQRKQATQELSNLEQKLMFSDRTNRQREQMIQQLNQQLQQLRYQLSTECRKSQVQQEQSTLKIEQLKHKLYDMETSNDFNNKIIFDYEEKVFNLEANISQCLQNLQFQTEKVGRKDKLLVEHTDRISDLVKELEEIKVENSQLKQSLNSAEESLDSYKEANERIKRSLDEQQQKNRQIKGFTNDLMKEKENVVKNEIQKSEKVVEQQNVIVRQKSQISELIEELQQSQRAKEELRTEMKDLKRAIAQLQDRVEEQKRLTDKAKDQLKQKDKKISEKDLEITNHEIRFQKSTTKYQSSLAQLKTEFDEALAKVNRELQDCNQVISELQTEVHKQENIIKKISDQNVSLEQQVFFERQTNALASSKFETMNSQSNELEGKLNTYMREIQDLNSQIRHSQQRLYDLSGRVYELEGRLQMKDIQIRQCLEKLDMDWKNKFEQTLEDYENRLQVYQKDKSYLKQKLDEQIEECERMNNCRRSAQIQQENDKNLLEQKIKKIESQKFAMVVQKNREIERLQSSVGQIQGKLKQEKYLKDLKEGNLHKLEEKIKEKDQQIKLSNERSVQTTKQLEKQLEHQRKKESQIKKYQENVKNSLWSSQRQIKKVIQGYVKHLIAVCSEQKKSDLMGIIKNIENSVVKAMQVNVEDIELV